jgi:hypothetical protein
VRFDYIMHGVLNKVRRKICVSFDFLALHKRQTSVGEGYEHHFVKRNYEFWRKVLHKVFGFFCDVETRICETLALRKDFRMIGTTLTGSRLHAAHCSHCTHCKQVVLLLCACISKMMTYKHMGYAGMP